MVEIGPFDCQPSDVQPSLCAWALSSDAIIVGEVQSVHLTNVPMHVRYANGASELVESESEALELCPRIPMRGLRLSVRVIDKLHTSDELPLSTDDVIDVHIGTRGMDDWSSTPVEFDDDFMVTGWAREAGIWPGDVLGFNVSLDVRGDATLGRNAMFVETDGLVEFFEVGRFCVPYEGSPVDEASGSYQQLKAGVLACTPSTTSSEELQQRAISRGQWDVPLSQGANCPTDLTQTGPG